MNLVMALQMESWTACVLLVCVGLLGEGELFAFAVGWVTEKGRLSDKEKKKLFLVCYGLCRVMQWNRFKGLGKRCWNLGRKAKGFSFSPARQIRN